MRAFIDLIRSPVLGVTVGVALVCTGAVAAHPLGRSSPTAAASGWPGPALSWSPDGRRIAFQSKGWLWVVALRSGRRVRVGPVTQVPRPYEWQSAEALVYASPQALRRYSLRTRRSKILVRGDFRFRRPHPFSSAAGRAVFDLSNDRRSLVGQRGRREANETFILSLRTGLLRVIARDPEDFPFPGYAPWQPQFGPGNVISWTETTNQFVIAIRENGRVRRIAAPGPVKGGPAWSRFSRPFAYMAEGRANIPESPVHIRFHFEDGRDVGIALGSNPRWSPDGALLAFDHPWPGETVIANAQGNVVRKFPASGFVWSPDGTKSAYLVPPAPYPARGSPHLYVAGPDGIGAIQIAPAAWSYYAAPAWSPDGRQLVFLSKDDPGIWVVRANGSGLRKVAPL